MKIVIGRARERETLQEVENGIEKKKKNKEMTTETKNLSAQNS